jgi:uncharacterized metal-binding protein
MRPEDRERAYTAVTSDWIIDMCSAGTAEIGCAGGRVAASLDRKRLGADFCVKGISIRGVFDKEVRRKPLAFAADACSYGI